jgi:CO/xanthine dehydrogenase FAD-binding subunit
MRPAKFEYFDPRTLDEALSLLKAYGEDAKILAGGLSLVPMMKLRLSEPKVVIDITKIPNLSYVIDNNGGGIKIGALTTYDTLKTSKLVKAKCPILAEAATSLGDSQIRNGGTIGGNICHADPACDFATATLALNAQFKAVRSGGERTIKSNDFFVDLFTSDLKPTEILTEIIVPSYLPNTGDSYLKLTQRSGDFAIVSVAAVMTLEKGGVCKSVSVVLGSVGPKPLKAGGVEEALLGKKISDKVIEQASELASQGINPSTDVHSSAGVNPIFS